MTGIHRALTCFIAFVLAVAPMLMVPANAFATDMQENAIVFNANGLSFNSEGRLVAYDLDTGLWNRVNLNENSDDIVPGEVLARANSLEHALEIAAAYGLELESYAYGIAVMFARNPEAAVFHSHATSHINANISVLSFNWLYSIDFEEDLIEPVTWQIADTSLIKSDEISMTVFEDIAHEQWAIFPQHFPVLSCGEVYYGTERGRGAGNLSPAVAVPHSVDMDHWQHEVMDNYRAWDISTGSGVVVAVIDTGIDINHPAFAGRILPNSFNSYTNQVGLLAVADDHGHGTHVSGIAAAAPTASVNVSGVAPQAYIMKIKANSPATGSFTSAALLRGINYAVVNGADIINMSLGRSHAFGPDPNEHLVIINAVNQGVTIIAAAGNSRESRAAFPSAYPEVIAVSSVWMRPEGPAFDAGYSNFGPEIDLAAPGTAIFAPIRNSRYGLMSGTSMAAPNVAGTAALVLSANTEFTPQDIRARLNSTARQAGVLGGDLRYGYGIVNSFAALLGPDNLYHVTYHFDDGMRTPVTTRVAPGARLIEPARHVSGNRILVDWRTSWGGSLFDFSRPITANMDLFANWEDTEIFGSWVVEFPDANFRHAVQRLLAEMDGVVRTDNSPMNAADIFLLSTVEQLTLIGRMGSEFRDMTGLSHFPNLTHLDLSTNFMLGGSGGSNGGHLFTSLDMSPHPKLQWLDISNNIRLQNVNVSNNPELVLLRAFQCNVLQHLDLSNNHKLEYLFLRGEPMGGLDFSNNPALRFLRIDHIGNRLMTSLDVSNNPMLEELRLHGQLITQLDFSNNPLLRVVVAQGQFEARGRTLMDINVSGNPELELLDIRQNNLTSLDLSQNTNLVQLAAADNRLASIVLPNSSQLAILNVADNQLTALNVSNNPGLGQLIINNNQISALDLSNNVRLGANTIVAGNGFITTHFGLLWANDNMLTSLDISNTAGNWNAPVRNDLIRLNLSANYIPAINSVVGWQGRNLVLDSNFIFDPQHSFQAKIRQLSIGNHPGEIDQVAGTITFNIPSDQIVNGRFEGRITELQADADMVVFQIGDSTWPLGLNGLAGIHTTNTDLVFVAGGRVYTIIIVPVYTAYFTVTVESGIGGGNFTAGQTVSIAAIVPERQQFVRWESVTTPAVNFANYRSESTTFVMPENNVTVRAISEPIVSYPEIQALSIGRFRGEVDQIRSTITFTIPQELIHYGRFEGQITELQADAERVVFWIGDSTWTLGLNDHAGIHTTNTDLVYVAGGRVYTIIIVPDAVSLPEITRLSIGRFEGVIDQSEGTIIFRIQSHLLQNGRFVGDITALQASSDVIVFYVGGSEWPRRLNESAGFSSGDLVYVEGGRVYSIIIKL